MLTPTPTPVPGSIRQRSRVLRLWPFIPVCVHTKSAVRPAQEQHPLQESISRSLLPTSGNYTLFKPFIWLENIFGFLIESQLILIQRKASSVIKSNTAVGKRITYIWVEIPHIINIFSKSKDLHFIHCSRHSLI